jgi:hypothetical protein
LTPEGEVIEHDQPDSREFEEIVFDNYEEECRRTWTSLQMVCPLEQICCPTFNPLIEHFLLRSCREEGIDQLIMHMTAIDAALGKQQKGATEAIRKRLKRLLNDEGASQEFKRLYDLRCAYIHGRGEDRPIPVSDLVSARRLARRTADAVLCYAGAHSGATRDQMLDELDGAKP